jgi:hypothetical protein
VILLVGQISRVWRGEAVSGLTTQIGKNIWRKAKDEIKGIASSLTLPFSFPFWKHRVANPVTL